MTLTLIILGVACGIGCASVINWLAQRLPKMIDGSEHQLPMHNHYPIVAIIAALLGGLLMHRYGLSSAVLWPACFALILLTAAATDARSMLLPDLLTLPLLWLGLLANLEGRFVPLDEAVLGAILGYLVLFIIALTFEWLFKKEGLGGGDMKLLAAMGAWLGWQVLMPVLFVAASIALIVATVVFIIKRQTGPAPLGPYLAMSGMGFFWCMF